MPALQNEKHELFAGFVANGMSPETAYESAGYVSKDAHVARTAALRLLQHVAIATRLAELQHVVEATAKRKAEAVAQVAKDEVETAIGRVRALALRRNKMLAVIEARSKFPDIQWAPGGDTGLVVTSEKALGKDAKIQTYEVDTGLLRELRETEKQIAIELSQWTEKTDGKIRFESIRELLERGSAEEIKANLAELKAWRAAQAKTGQNASIQ